MLRKGGKDSACKRDVPQLHCDPCRLGKPEPDDDEDVEDVDGVYDSMSDLGEIRVYQRADFQSGSRVLKKVF